MSLNLVRRIVKGTSLTAQDHDTNLDKLENGIEARLLSNAAAVTNAREWTADTIGQAEAEAGTAATRRAFTAQRVFQAVAAWWAASSAKTKLDGIATGATANATDAALRDRATHTGTQGADTITGLATVATTGAYSDLSGTPSIPGPTDLTYDAATREVRSSTGDDAVLPLVTSSTAGLQPASGYGTITYAAQVTLDFAALDKQMNTISLTGDLELLTSNLANSREVRLRLVNDATERTLTFPTDWKFVGTKPSTIAASKVAILSLGAFGTTNADVVAAYAVQS